MIGKLSVFRVYQGVVEALKNPDAVKSLTADGIVASVTSPEDFTKFVNAEIAEWTKLAQEMKLEKLSLR